MSYSIVLFPNLIFNILEIIWTPEIFNNCSRCEILIFQIVEVLLFSKLEIFVWDTKNLMIKCRTAGVSEFLNCEY